MGLLAGLRGDILELSAAGNGRCRLIAAALLVEKQVPGAPVVDRKEKVVGIAGFGSFSSGERAKKRLAFWIIWIQFGQRNKSRINKLGNMFLQIFFQLIFSYLIFCKQDFENILQVTAVFQ